MEPAEKLAAIASTVQALRDLDKTSLEKTYKETIREEVLQCLNELKILNLKSQTGRRVQMEPAAKLAAIASAVTTLRDLNKTSLEKDHKQEIRDEVLQCLKQLKIIQFKQQTYRPQGELQDEILEALASCGQATSAKLAEVTGHEPNPVNSTMTRLKRQGLVRVVEMVPNPDYGKGSGRRAETVALYERVAQPSIKPGRRLGSLQRQIMEALRECGTATPATIGEMIERDNQAVSTALTRLKKQGVVRVARMIANPKCGSGQPAKIPLYQLADSYQELFVDEPDDDEP